MPYFNQGRAFADVNENPLVKSVFVRIPDDQGLVPPPTEEFIITQSGLFITTQNGDFLVTQPV